MIFCSSNKKTNVKSPVLFGTMPDGTQIFRYTVTNDNDLSAEIINFGARVVTLKVPNKNGKVEDVILGFDNLDGYINDNSFQGAIVGRYGNRIGRGKFILDGQEYQLTINDGPNHLHGGKKGFFKSVWKGTQLSKKSVQFALKSPDSDEGYPGNVDIVVTYTISNDNEFKVEYSGVTDKTTILNPTSHCYFNLTEDPEKQILDHELLINADFITPVDNILITTGDLMKVAGTAFDFTNAKPIGRDIMSDNEQLKFGKGFDHNWVLKNYNGKIQKVAELYEPQSGRLMEVFTDQPGLQFYSGNFLDGSMTGKHGVKYQYRTALCLEAQCFPDSPNKPDFPSASLKPGDKYTQLTIYKFSTR